eukprot:snap_masked-scaffold_1-processed-gene-6.23-mRNA-1 protein AED:1.00 eAED:1.00 QI:0/0/0/0/1/1/3/0/167
MFHIEVFNLFTITVSSTVSPEKLTIILRLQLQEKTVTPSLSNIFRIFYFSYLVVKSLTANLCSLKLFNDPGVFHQLQLYCEYTISFFGNYIIFPDQILNFFKLIPITDFKLYQYISISPSRVDITDSKVDKKYFFQNPYEALITSTTFSTALHPSVNMAPAFTMPWF